MEDIEFDRFYHERERNNSIGRYVESSLLIFPNFFIGDTVHIPA